MQMQDALLDLEIRLAQGLRRDAARVGLREATARLLLALAPGEEILMGELSRRLARNPSTATRFADRAVADGLLARRAGTGDRRRRMVALTPAGERARAALAGVQQRRAEALAQAILAETGLGGGQVEWFLNALARGLDLGFSAPAGM
jgi:DNA-binding MarR family transcriptional regulator